MSLVAGGGRSLSRTDGPDGSLLTFGGAPAKNLPGVPPLLRGVQDGGGPVGAAGPGGRSPGPSGVPGGRSQDWGGAPSNLLGVAPPDSDYPGAPAKLLPGVPPFAARRASRGGPGGADGLGGRSPRQSGGPGGRSLDRGGAPPILLGVPPPRIVTRGLPLCCEACIWGGGWWGWWPGWALTNSS